MEIIQCETCGEDTPLSHRGKRYCSRQCWLKKHNTPERNTEVSRRTAEQRANKLRYRGEGRAYTKRHGRHEHRVVMEEKLGRPLRPGEIVHHKDHNRLNNHPDNLEVMTQSEHARLHAAERRNRKEAS